MIALDLSLTAQAERYILSHPCCHDYAHQLRKRCKKLTEFAGGWLAIGELTCDLVNEWLLYVAKDKSSSTVNSYRRSILAIWNDAYLAGLVDEPPLRVRRVRVRQGIVHAYTLDEIRQLIAAAKLLPGCFRNGMKRSLFWEAMIRVAYESGLRRGDILSMRWSSVASDGGWCIIQSKTGHPHRGKFSRNTMAVLKRVPRKELLLPFPSTIRYFGMGFESVRKRAGIERGSFKWLRRSAGSYAEQRRAGDGAKLLGHKDPRVFEKFYRDRMIADDEPVVPPPL